MGLKLKYKNKILEYESGVTLKKISQDLKQDFKHDVLVASINNRTVFLDKKITKNCSIDFYDISSNIGNNCYKRGIIFLFIKAVKDVLNCDVRLKYLINDEIYIEILTNNIISEVTVQKIKIRMRKLQEQKIPINKIMVSRIEAIEYYEKLYQFDKAKSLRYISNSSISLYRMDDTLDYFYGVLPNNTCYLDKFNVKYIGNNDVVLLYPGVKNVDQELKYIKNDKIIETIENSEKIKQNLQIITSSQLNKTISNDFYSNLITLCENIQNNKLFSIADNIVKNKNIKLILITGPSSSGKTTVSKKLSLFLKSKGLNPIPISTDDFYIDIDKRVLNEEGKPEMESIDAIDTLLFNKIISKLLDKKEVNMPKYNFQTGKQELSEKAIKMDESSILIVEGIHSFDEKLTEIIPEKNKFKLFINPFAPVNIDNHNLIESYDDRLLRRLIRDNKTRGASASLALKLWKDVRKSEDKYIFPYMKYADEIFNTYMIYEIGVLKTYVEPLLFSVSEDDENYEEAIRLINLLRLILSMPSESIPKDSIIREFIGDSCFM